MWRVLGTRYYTNPCNCGQFVETIDWGAECCRKPTRLLVVTKVNVLQSMRCRCL